MLLRTCFVTATVAAAAAAAAGARARASARTRCCCRCHFRCQLSAVSCLLVLRGAPRLGRAPLQAACSCLTIRPAPQSCVVRSARGALRSHGRRCGSCCSWGCVMENAATCRAWLVVFAMIAMNTRKHITVHVSASFHASHAHWETTF
eukprot:6185651-Pleurochrysis_carterae.AAC.1